MKKQKKPTYKIFSFADIDLDVLYDNLVNLNKQIDTSVDNSAVLNAVFEQYNQTIPVVNNPVIPRKKEIIEKYQFLIHLLITKCYYKGYVDLPADYFKYLFGDYYSKMLLVLELNGSITRSDYYGKGKSFRRITLHNKNIHCRQKYDASFEKYYMRYNKRKDIMIKDNTSKLQKIFGKKFINHYIKNINQLKITDSVGAGYYINSSDWDYYKKEMNLYLLDKYHNGNYSISIDQNNRIYSILTNTNRNLRFYTNIKYIIDISNCHPLLFNKYIIDKYNIDINTLSLLNNIDLNNIIIYNKNNTISIQYVSNVFTKLLSDNNIQIENLNGISNDELLYIALTFQGKFWEFVMLNENFIGVEREETKEKMFQEVFYGKSLGGNRMVYQNEFKVYFPNVFKLIIEFRKQHRKGEKHLANHLMRFESEIIHNTLKRLFTLNYCVINIHDAIVVLDVEQNNDIEINEIIGVINDELLQHKLFGRLKT